MTKKELVTELLNMGLSLGDVQTSAARKRLIELGESLVDDYVKENVL